MPRFDGTGPWGTGPGAGWGLGPCGLGLRRGLGRGYGRGWFGRGPGRQWFYQSPTAKEEIEMLREEAEALRQELKETETLIQDLRTKKKK